MVGNKKVYMTRIDQTQSSTKKIPSNYVLRTKILKNYRILLNCIAVNGKISAPKPMCRIYFTLRKNSLKEQVCKKGGGGGRSDLGFKCR